MTKHHFSRMKQAAHALVNLANDPTQPVDPEVLAWARQIVLQNPTPAPFRPSPNQDAVLQLLDDAPCDGLTAEQIADKVGKSKRLMSVTLAYMLNTAGLICAIKLSTHSVYFRNAAALAIGKPLVLAADERRRAMLQKKQGRPPLPSKVERDSAKLEAKAQRKAQRDAEKLEKKRLAEELKNTQRLAMKAEREARRETKRGSWSVRNQPKPKRHQDMTIKSRPASDAIATPRKPRIDESIFTPPHVVKQVIPTPADTRFTADPGSEGAGFGAEWRRLRGEAT